MARSALDELRDDVYVLACAIEDTDADLEACGDSAPTAELQRILDWLLAAARPLASRQIPAPTAPAAISS